MTTPMHNALILAAGMARRLRPLTDDRPKCLLEVKGKPLLARAIDACHAAGLTSVTIVTGYRGEMIREFVAKHYPDGDFRFIDNPDYATTNNIHSLWMARNVFRGTDFMLLDSDILFPAEILTRLMAHGDTCLAVNTHELGDEEIKVIVDGQHRVQEISKTCSVEDAMGESVGLECIRAPYASALAQELELMIETEGLSDIFYERAFERLIPRGHQFVAVDTTDLPATEIDTVDDYNQVSGL